MRHLMLIVVCLCVTSNSFAATSKCPPADQIRHLEFVKALSNGPSWIVYSKVFYHNDQPWNVRFTYVPSGLKMVDPKVAMKMARQKLSGMDFYEGFLIQKDGRKVCNYLTKEYSTHLKAFSPEQYDND